MTFALVMVTSMTTAAYADNSVSSTSASSKPLSIPSLNGECGEVDLVFIVDDTGSMGDVIDNVKDSLLDIADVADDADSDGEARLGLVTFKDSVEVDFPLSTSRSDAIDGINALVASGGAGAPEASNEAKNTVVNSLDERAGQTGDFAPTPADDWSGDTNIAIIFTDAPPGGFDDTQDASDGTDLADFGSDATANGIKVSDILVGFSVGDTATEDLYEANADNAGGIFVTDAEGDDVVQAILDIIGECGGPGISVGGSIASVNTTALFVSGMFSSWMIPALAGAAGTGYYFAQSRLGKKHEDN